MLLPFYSPFLSLSGSYLPCREPCRLDLRINLPHYESFRSDRPLQQEPGTFTKVRSRWLTGAGAAQCVNRALQSLRRIFLSQYTDNIRKIPTARMNKGF